MSRTLPTELVRAMNGTESDLPLAAFLRVKHAALDNPLLVVNYPNEVRNTKGLWKSFPFSVTLPAIGDDQVPVLHVTVANITLELTEIARRIAGTADLAKCDIYILNADLPERPGLSCEDYEVLYISDDLNSFTFELRLYILLDRELAKYRFTPTLAEGLF